jgi:hypothetical protein
MTLRFWLGAREIAVSIPNRWPAKFRNLSDQLLPPIGQRVIKRAALAAPAVTQELPSSGTEIIVGTELR